MSFGKKFISIILAAIMALSIIPVSYAANPTVVSKWNGVTYTYHANKTGYDVIDVIDVSYANGNINWDMVKTAGIENVIIRVGRRGYGEAGTIGLDTTFKTNIEGAIRVGMNIGIYFYSQAITVAEGQAEAQFAIDNIAPYSDYINLPVYHDYEYAGTSEGRFDSRRKNGTLTKADCTAISDAFCTTIKNAGYTPGINCSADFFTNDLNTSELSAKGYEIWLAYYTTSTQRNSYYWHYSHPDEYNMWQYEDDEVPGMQYSSSSWVGVTYNGYSGYIMANYLDFTTGEVDKAATNAKVNLRESKSTSSTALTQVPSGETVVITSYPTGNCDLNFRFINNTTPEPDPEPDPTPSPSTTNTIVSRFDGCTYTFPTEKIGDTVIDVIDVSYAQGNINWDMVKTAGIENVVIRLGRRGYGEAGSIALDSNFATNMEGAIRVGMNIGVYFYSQAITVTEGRAEAQFCIDNLAPYSEYINLPVYHDYEYAGTSEGRFDSRRAAGTLTKADCTAISDAFCTTIKNAGYTPGINCSAAFFTSDLNTDQLVAKGYEIWLAYYTYNTQKNSSYWHYSHPNDYNMWQYEDDEVPGMQFNSTSWVGVSYGNYSGYMRADCLDFTTGQRDKAEVNAYSNLRASASTSSTALTQINEGEIVDITSYPTGNCDLNFRFISNNTPDKSHTVESNVTGETYTYPLEKSDMDVAECIKVSNYDMGSDKTIDWKVVKNSGIDYAMIRIGFSYYSSGTSEEDESFASYIAAAKAANLKVGVYFTSKATSKAEAQAEADKVVEYLGSTSLDLPVYMDYRLNTAAGSSDRVYSLTSVQRANNAVYFCSRIESAKDSSGNSLGLKAGLHTANGFISNKHLTQVSQRYRIWIEDTATNDITTGSNWQNLEDNQNNWDAWLFKDKADANVPGINYSATSSSYEWVNVTSESGKTGYVSSYYLNFSITEKNIATTTGTINYRSSAALGNNVLGQFASGTRVTINSYDTLSTSGKAFLSFMFTSNLVKFKDDDGTYIKTKRAVSGIIPSDIDGFVPELPQKDPDDDYHYTSSWNKNTSAAINADKTFTVVYTPIEHIWYINHTKEATCTEAGKNQLECTANCGATKEEIIAALGHQASSEPHRDMPVNATNGAIYYDCERCHNVYYSATYNTSTNEYEPSGTAYDTVAEIKSTTDALPAPTFNDFYDEDIDYDYSRRGASLKVNIQKDEEIDAGSKQTIRFAGAMQIPFNISNSLGDNNQLKDFGFVFSQTERMDNDINNLVLGGTDVAMMSVKDNNAPNTDIPSWSGCSTHIFNDNTKLTFNLVVAVSYKNWQKDYCARAYVKYVYNGFEYTVYDDVISSRSVEYVATQAVNNEEEYEYTRWYCQKLLDSLN